MPRTYRACPVREFGGSGLMDRRTGQPGPARSDRVLGQPGPARSNAPGQNGDDTWTVRKSASSSPGCIEALAATSMIVVTHNAGLTVAEATDLRRRMRAAGVTFRVAKNRLAHLALEGTQFDGLKPLLKGPTALAWSTDPVAVAKTAVEFAKTNEKLVLIGGALGTQTLDAAGVQGARRTAEPGCAACPPRGDDFHPRDPDRRHPPGARPDSSLGSLAPSPGRTRTRRAAA